MRRKWLCLRPLGPAAALFLAAVLLAGCSSQPVELAAIGPGSPSGAPTPGTTGLASPSAASSFQPAFPGQPAPSSSPGGAAVCPASGIEVVAGEPDAATGLRQVTLRAENCGKKALTLKGYPALRLLDEDGVEQPVALRKGVISISFSHNPKAVAIHLGPGHSAMALLTWRNVTTVGGVAITAAYVRIVPAPHELPQTIAQTVDVGTTGRIAVTAWERYKKLT